MKARVWLLLGAAATSAACVWRDAVYDTRLTPSGDAPVDAARTTGSSTSPAQPSAGTVPAPGPGPGGPNVPRGADGVPLPRPAYSAPSVTPVPLLGMLILATEAPPASAVATLRLSLPVGGASGAVGLAALTAEVVAELAPPSLPGGSLRRALELQGASLTISVTAETTAFEVVLPVANLGPVLGALGERLALRIDPEVTGTAVGGLRQGLARRLAEARLRAPLPTLLATNEAERDAARTVSELNLRTAHEVALFHRARYRAAGALLALWVPGKPTAEQVLAVRDGLLPWLDPLTPAYKPVELVESAPVPAGRWIERDSEPQVALSLPMPGIGHPFAAELMALRECFSHEGVGGRLDTATQALVGRSVGFDPIGDAPDDCVLGTSASADLVIPLWQVAARAQASMLSQPPSKAELAVAAARARLRLLGGCAEPSAWLRRITELVHRRGTLDSITDCLARLESPERLRVTDALATFAAIPLALTAVGKLPSTTLPANVVRVPEMALPQEGADNLLPPAETAERERAAAPYVARAIAALGGEDSLRNLRGYHTVVQSDAGEGPTCETTTELLPTGELRETRKILATTIETVITRNAGQEVASGQRIELTLDEIRMRQAAAARHPLLLLARALRGELRLRLVSLRAVGDREFAVLEADDERSARLRLSIDTGNGLLRVVELREWNQEAGLQTTVDEYEDYRTVAGGRRTPFFKTRALGDDRARLRTSTVSFEPR